MLSLGHCTSTRATRKSSRSHQMIQDLLIDLANDIEGKLNELQQKLNNIEQHLETIRERAERLQPSLKEGETNVYTARGRELECDKFHTELAIKNLSDQITRYKQRLYELIVEKET